MINGCQTVTNWSLWPHEWCFSNFSATLSNIFYFSIVTLGCQMAASRSVGLCDRGLRCFDIHFPPASTKSTPLENNMDFQSHQWNHAGLTFNAFVLLGPPPEGRGKKTTFNALNFCRVLFFKTRRQMGLGLLKGCLLETEKQWYNIMKSCCI